MNDLERKCSIDCIHSWLESKKNISIDKKYRHQIITEKTELTNNILSELEEYIKYAHIDSINYLRKPLKHLLENDLDPTGSNIIDPAEGYPEKLPPLTLQGYFGEIFAGIIAENFKPFNLNNWKIPVYLFRCHLESFRYLKMQQQCGEDEKQRKLENKKKEIDRYNQKIDEINQDKNPKDHKKKKNIEDYDYDRIIGRTGDDNLAFIINDNNEVIACLCMESKCTLKHDISLIHDAHFKISERNWSPLDLLQLIAILEDYGDDESKKWLESLSRLSLYSEPPKGFQRYDLICYLYGTPAKNGKTRISTISPDELYSAGRKLEAVEVCLPQIASIIKDVYNKEEDFA